MDRLLAAVNACLRYALALSLPLLLLPLGGGCSTDPVGLARITEVRAAQSIGGALVPTSLPKSWRVAQADDHHLKIDFDFDAGAGATPDLGIFVAGTTLVFTAWVNGHAVHATGDLQSPAIPSASSRAVPSFRIPAAVLLPGENRVRLEATVPAGESRAYLGPLLLGSANLIERHAFVDWIGHVGVPSLVGATLFAFGLTSLGLWRRRTGDPLFLLLGIGALLWGLQLLLRHWPIPFLPLRDRSVIGMALYVWYPMAISVFFLRFAYRRSRAYEILAVTFSAIVLPLMYLAWYQGVYLETHRLVRAAVLLMITFALFAVFRYAWKTRTWTSAVLLVIGAICVLTSARDYFVTLFSAPGARPVFWIEYAGLALVAFAGWVLLERYHRAFAENEALNRDLEARVHHAGAELQRRLHQVETAHAAAEQANIAKSRFFAAASHDLRQPLHSLGLFAEGLSDHVATPQGQSLVRRIGESISALDSLFDELLDLSKLDAGTVDVRRRRVALQSIFDRLDIAFANEASAKGLRLRLVPTRAAVETDPALCERILRNLISNSLRYTVAGGVVVGARFRGDRVGIEVCDTGIGIPADQQALVFDEFYQVDNPARDRRKGLGLGLAIVRRLANLLDVPLSLRSLRGHGTRFSMNLPRAEGPVDKIETAPPEVAGVLTGCRVLLIEDDPEIVDATGCLLEQWQVEFLSASAADGAVTAVRSGFIPDAVLADLRLGHDEDGIDAIEQVRQELGVAIPALLLSGDTAARTLARVRESGLLLLTKPVAPAKLRSVLHALLLKEDQSA